MCRPFASINCLLVAHRRRRFVERLADDDTATVASCNCQFGMSFPLEGTLQHSAAPEARSTGDNREGRSSLGFCCPHRLLLRR